MADNILLTYYGDDFTGSTDVMEALTLNGIPAALFLAPPTVAELDNFRLKNTGTRVRALGVAGISRTMNPQEMETQLADIFAGIARVPSKYFHYKVCSTFDSSPQKGSIGKAIEIALKYFPSQWVPLLVAAPALNRYCVFGNLFARVANKTYRLDRHPTMSVHPVTPMHESDLRLHLSEQTGRQVQLADLHLIEAGDEGVRVVEKMITHADDAPIVLFDTLSNKHLALCGQIINELSKGSRQLIVGSSGVEYALSSFLRGNTPQSRQLPETSDGPEQMIVVAGSCSPGTKAQIEKAVDNGFAALRLDTSQLTDAYNREAEIALVISSAAQILAVGGNVIVYTALGPYDKAIDNTKADAGNYIGECLGIILKQLLNYYGKSRVVVAGGDTSGHVTRALGIYALELLMPIAPGAPLCTAHSTIKVYDGLKIALKGGQNGDDNYFMKVRNAGISNKQPI